MQITFVGDNGIYSPIFQIKILNQYLILLIFTYRKYYEELENITPPQLMIDVIKNARAMQIEGLGISEKLIDNSNEIKKIKKYMNQDGENSLCDRTRQRKTKTF